MEQDKAMKRPADFRDALHCKMEIEGWVHLATTVVRDDVLTVGLIELQDQERQFWERQQSNVILILAEHLHCLPQTTQEQK